MEASWWWNNMQLGTFMSKVKMCDSPQFILIDIKTHVVSVFHPDVVKLQWRCLPAQ